MAAAFVAVVWPLGDASAGNKALIDHGDGTWSVAVRANFSPDSLAALEVTSADAQDYCEIFREASNRLWTLSNGQHYFESVSFSYGATDTDVFLHKGQRSLANGNRVLLQFKTPHPSGADAIHSQTLAHEWGHYFYGLADEYSSGRDLGWCANGQYNSPDESCSVFPSSSCTDGARCVRHGTCVNEGGPYDGFVLKQGAAVDEAEIAAWGVVSEGQCAGAGGTGPHPVCVLYDPSGEITHPEGPESWANWGASCAVDGDCDGLGGEGEGRCTAGFAEGGFERSICEGPSACIMSSHTGKQHWCDGSSHQHADADGVNLAHNRSVLAAAYRNPHMDRAEEYNCWDQAKSAWGALQFDGQYEDVGLPPNAGDPDFCTWNVPDYDDAANLADWSMIMIDASGSMGADANGVPGWTYAVDGAEYFNQVAFAKGSRAGIYGFGDDLWPVQWGELVGEAIEVPAPGTQELVLGEVVDLSQETVALYRAGVGAYVNEAHSTNLCTALEGARDAFAKAGAPVADREVVMLTDAHFNTWWSDPEASCRGVKAWIQIEPSMAGQICSEGQMRINVIATGASPNIDLAQWLADSCNGWVYYADSGADGVGYGEALGSLPHAAKVYAAMSKAVVAGEQIALHERARLDASTESEARKVSVPPGTASLEVAWIGAPLELTASPTAQAFDALGFRLESPSGVVAEPAVDSSELDALYRRVAVNSPEPGVWLMHLDKSGFPRQLRSAVEVGWLAAIDHPYVADAWVERPVWGVGDTLTIFGSVTDGEYDLGGLRVAARISAGSQSWELPMFDDGTHGDGAAGDGVYAASFQPSSAGPYAVKVDYDVQPGISHTIPGEPIFGEGPGPELLDHPASLVAHATFEARTGRVGLIGAELPPLRAGSTQTRLRARLSGLFVPSPGVTVSLGQGVQVRDLELECVSCAETSGLMNPAELVYELRFNVDVSPDAPVTRRDLLVEIGSADYVLKGATSVVSGERPADQPADQPGDPGQSDKPGSGCAVTSAGSAGWPLGVLSVTLLLFALALTGVGRRA